MRAIGVLLAVLSLTASAPLPPPPPAPCFNPHLAPTSVILRYTRHRHVWRCLAQPV